MSKASEAPLQEVKRLQSVIKQATVTINRIQKRCKHPVVRHKLYPDIYCGQGYSSECLVCGKHLGCLSSHTDKIEKRTWVERKVSNE